MSDFLTEDERMRLEFQEHLRSQIGKRRAVRNAGTIEIRKTRPLPIRIGPAPAPPPPRVPKDSAAHARERKYRVRIATAPWADRAAIKAIYARARELTRETGVRHHVDHEIPLCGKLVSGLHVEANLRILTAEQNVRRPRIFTP